jgi:uncharacterized protein YbbK (DUF523 family)
MKPRPTALVSACLLGVNCRYDGGSQLNQTVIDYLQREELTPIPVCPEQLGGLPTPRPKAWFSKGDGREYLNNNAQLTAENGLDVGPAFLRGAREVLRIARVCRCESAILKQRSPSCGSRRVYLNGELIDGVGITCALLQKEGLKVTCEESLT